MGSCKGDSRLTGFQVLLQRPISDSRVRIQQIILVTVGLTNRLYYLVIVIAVGMNMTAHIFMRSQEFNNPPKVGGTAGIESRGDTVLSGFWRELARLDIIVEDVILILNADETLDRQAHLLRHQPACEISEIGTRNCKHQVRCIHLLLDQLGIGPEIVKHLRH